MLFIYYSSAVSIYYCYLLLFWCKNMYFIQIMQKQCIMSHPIPLFPHELVTNIQISIKV